MSYGAGGTDPTIWTDAANQSYWDNQSLVADTVVNLPAEPSFGFSRASLVFSRTTPSGTREDVAVTHLDWAHIDIGVCTPLSGTEMGEVETAIGTFMTARAANYHTGIVLDRIRWAEYQPITTRPGPVVRDTDVNYQGSGTARLPDQVAITSTYHTASRRHWGRSYWPFGVNSNLDASFGRVSNTACDNIADALHTLLDTDGAGDGIAFVVASIEHHGVMNVREMVVDNVPDIIRRRRAKQSSYRRVKTP